MIKSLILGLTLTTVPLERKHGFQPIDYESKPGKTEFLILSTSHGNPGDITTQFHRVRGGDWEKVIKGGNDDKGITIWRRDSRRRGGKIDIKMASAELAVVSFDENYCWGETDSRKLLRSQEPMIENPGTSNLWLVVVASDSGGKSEMALESWGEKKDDPVFLYLDENKVFRDHTTGRIRGSMVSIELVEC